MISEVMYHPRPTAANPENNLNDEYIELYNPSSSDVTLDTPAEGGPWRIDGGAQYTFPSNVVIPAGGYIVVVPFNPTNNVEASNDFCVAYGLTNGQVRMFGGYQGHLDNESDRVALERPVAPDLPGESTGWFEVDEVKYWDQSPWPLGVDGTGKPLQRKLTGEAGTIRRTGWRALSATPGYAAVKVAITNPANESALPGAVFRCHRGWILTTNVSGYSAMGGILGRHDKPVHGHECAVRIYARAQSRTPERIILQPDLWTMPA